MVVRLSMKRVVPGSIPPWRAPLFSWPRSDFRLPGAVFRAPAVVFHFRPFLMTRRIKAPRLWHGDWSCFCDASEGLRAAVSSQTFSVKNSGFRSEICGFGQGSCSLPLLAASRLRNFAAAHARRSFVALSLLSCAGRVLKLALGSGSWVGGIKIETFDELRFQKSTAWNL